MSRLDYIPAAAIADGDLELQPAVPGGVRLGRRDAGLQANRERGAVANEANTDTIGVQLGNLPLQRLQEQTHEARHFLRRALPVLTGKSEQGQRQHAAARAFLHDQAGRGESFLVPRRPWQTPRGGPAAVAIHDDGDVPGYAARRRSRCWRGQTCMTSFSLAASS